MAGITDVFATVTLPKPEYEKLVRESEKIAILREMLDKSSSVLTADIRAIVGEKKEKGREV